MSHNASNTVKRKRRLWLKIIIILIILVVGFVLCASYFKGNILPVVLTMSEATIKAMAVNAINSAANMVISNDLKYEEMVNIVKDGEGRIQMVQANTVKINRIARELATLSQTNIELITEQSLELPLGAFTGSVTMAGWGPAVKIELLPIGSVQCEFISVFEEVGINQTRHGIYVNINSCISLVLPVSSVPVNTTTTILVCENIIVGEVPQFYLSSGGGSSLIDLIPYT